MAYPPVMQYISPTYKFIALFSAGIRAGQPAVPLAQMGTTGEITDAKIPEPEDVTVET
jgi:hypothetical protein